MFQRISFIFLLGVSLVSCEFFKKKELVTETAIDTVIDYSTIDIFPLYPDCGSIENEEEQRDCTSLAISEYISDYLSDNEMVVSFDIDEVVEVKINVDYDGELLFMGINASDDVLEELPMLRGQLKECISEMPLLKPAIKRGIPVAVELTIPIIVSNY